MAGVLRGGCCSSRVLHGTASLQRCTLWQASPQKPPPPTTDTQAVSYDTLHTPTIFADSPMHIRVLRAYTRSQSTHPCGHTCMYCMYRNN